MLLTPLGTAEEEAALCRAAFAGVDVGALVRFCHHRVPVEELTGPAENRIACILTTKAAWEQPARLRAFRPVPPELITAELDKARAAWAKARAAWVKAYAELVKARAELDKAYAELVKARAEWDMACAEWALSSAEWADQHADFIRHDCTWDGVTLFS